jgi:hypothetical protein
MPSGFFFLEIFLERNSMCLLLFLFHRTKFRVVFSYAEWFRTGFREYAFIYVSRYRIPSIFLLCGKVRTGIPRASVPRTAGIREIIVPSIPSSAE